MIEFFGFNVSGEQLALIIWGGVALALAAYWLFKHLTASQ